MVSSLALRFILDRIRVRVLYGEKLEDILVEYTELSEEQKQFIINRV